MTMFCPDEERLSAWVDRGLTPGEDETISTHLAACEECRRAVTLAFLVDRESPESLSDEGQQRLFHTVQGALVQPSKCISDEELAAWLHDGLPPAERSEVTDHLAECDDCRRTAALSRLSNSEPVSALGAAQETRALNLVLRSAGRDVFFSFWRVAAASLLVAIAATYIAIQWSGPSASPRSVVDASTSEERVLGAGHVPGSTNRAGTVMPPEAPEKRAPAAPEPAKIAEPVPPVPARFLHVPVFETEGLTFKTPGRITYADPLRPNDTAWINVEGRALVVLDASSEAKVAYAADAGAYVLELTRGRAFIDTAGDEQAWEIRRGDRTVTLRAFRGRATAKAEDPAGMRVDILRGAADVGPDRVEEGRGVEVQKDSSVILDPKEQGEQRKKACEALTARYKAIRPQSLLVLRAAGGKDCTDGPWQYHSPSRRAELLEEGAMISECADPIRWVRIELDRPLRFTSDMVLSASCGGTGSKLYLWVGGKEAWYREATRRFEGTGPEEWPLRGLHKDMVDIIAGDELRKIMIGVVQERGRESTLEVDGIEIRRVLD